MNVTLNEEFQLANILVGVLGFADPCGEGVDITGLWLEVGVSRLCRVVDEVNTRQGVVAQR